MLNCNNCKNNCTSERETCYCKDECKGWYIFLTTSSSTWHAKGINVGIKFDYKNTEMAGLHTKYKQGDYFMHSDLVHIDADWCLNGLQLDWQPMERPYTPTLKDKIRKLFTGKPFPVTVDVRPEDSTIVIAKYGDGTHYEIVEYKNRTWVTELCYPIVPSNWAYLPTEIINCADSIIKEKGEKK